MKIHKILEKIKDVILPSLLIVISYMLLGPLEVFFGNTKDFSFSYTSFIGILLGLGLVFVAVCCMLALILPAKARKIFGAVLAFVGVASYIQNMFLNGRLSQDNGAPMDWDSLAVQTGLNLVLWVLILVIFAVAYVLLKKNWRAVSSSVCGFLCAIQIVAVISILVPAMGNGTTVPTDEGIGLSGEKQFQVAPGHNIVVFVVDTLGTQQIDEIKSVYPDALDGFEDFTFYSNADCTFYCTFPSMTHLFTGNPLDFNANSLDWEKESWDSERGRSFFEKLHSKKYTCNLYSNEIGYVYGSIDNLDGKWDNIGPVEQVVNKPLAVELLLKISAYRYVPYVIKPHLEVLTKDFDGVVSYKDDEVPATDNADFLSALRENGLLVDKSAKNAFIVEHLFGTHAPYTTSADGQKVEESTCQDVGCAMFLMIREYLENLKELGRYDDATIIIMGDHGRWFGSDPQPVFMVKEQGETHEEMWYNAAPISYMDFQATIMKMIGSDTDLFQTSIYDWHEADTRERTVYMRANCDDMPAVKGSSFNAYYGYTYYTDKTELLDIINNGPTVIKPATPW